MSKRKKLLFKLFQAPITKSFDFQNFIKLVSLSVVFNNVLSIVNKHVIYLFRSLKRLNASKLSESVTFHCQRL